MKWSYTDISQIAHAYEFKDKMSTELVSFCGHKGKRTERTVFDDAIKCEKCLAVCEEMRNENKEKT